MFEGRLSVAGYWGGVLVMFCLYIIAGLLSAILGFAGFKAILQPSIVNTDFGSLFAGLAGGSLIAFICMLLVSVFAAFCAAGMQVRRLHDLNLSGWFLLLFWVASFLVTFFGRSGTLFHPMYSTWSLVASFVLSIGGLVVLFWPGKIGTNKYGPALRYRSWWAAFIGSKVGAIVRTPQGSEGLVTEKRPS